MTAGADVSFVIVSGTGSSGLSCQNGLYVLLLLLLFLLLLLCYHSLAINHEFIRLQKPCGFNQT